MVQLVYLTVSAMFVFANIVVLIPQGGGYRLRDVITWFAVAGFAVVSSLVVAFVIGGLVMWVMRWATLWRSLVESFVMNVIAGLLSLFITLSFFSLTSDGIPGVPVETSRRYGLSLLALLMVLCSMIIGGAVLFFLMRWHEVKKSWWRAWLVALVVTVAGYGAGFATLYLFIWGVRLIS